MILVAQTSVEDLVEIIAVDELVEVTAVDDVEIIVVNGLVVLGG
jgi:hypothetical protein